jgi:ribonuclease III
MPISDRLITELEAALGYRFPDRALLEQAFVHSSDDSAGRVNYQRLEFLGDEVVGLAVSTLLFRRFTGADEGTLSRARANLIDEAGLADLARALGLGALLVLGKGEELSGGREKESILADVFESLMAVVYLTGGWEAAFRVIDILFTPRFGESRDIEALLLHIDRDHKTRLQEITQKTGDPLPEYLVIEKIGPEHESLFTVECRALGFSARGNGRNHKAAQQDSARRMIALLRESDRGG